MEAAAVRAWQGSRERFDAGRTAAPRRSELGAGEVCTACNLRHDVSPLCPRVLEEVGATRRRLARGETLFRPGEPFVSIYTIRSGSCKTVMLTGDGREQVTAYYIRGEFVGVEGVGTAVHRCEAVALEDSEVCVLPFARLEEMARAQPQIQRSLYRVFATEAARERSVMLMLGTMRAEQRLAAFLLDLSRRYHERGYSSTEFVLRMTREEIGSYLGLKLETVSRIFSQMHRSGLVHVQSRLVKLRDPLALRGLIQATFQ